VLDGTRTATDTGLLISVLLPAQIAFQVIQPCEQRLEFDQALGGWGPSLWSGQAAVSGEEHCINPISFTQNSHAFGKTADLSGIDETDRHAFGSQEPGRELVVGRCRLENSVNL
jgi:hypothetical protein